MESPFGDGFDDGIETAPGPGGEADSGGAMPSGETVDFDAFCESLRERFGDAEVERCKAASEGETSEGSNGTADGPDFDELCQGLDEPFRQLCLEAGASPLSSP